jgi:Methyltransferase domain
MNDLERIFYHTDHRICQKWAHYFRIYERFFAQFRGSDDFRMMEIGISQGGSLDMWRAYFGATALIVGVDIDSRCRVYEDGRTVVRIGSQEDPRFLRELAQEFHEFDLVLDDGGHTMTQQTMAFEFLYPTVRPGGVYMVEDCHTSYHSQYGGGLRQRGTFIEFAKLKIDELNGFHIHSNPDFLTNFTQTTTGVSFFDSIVVFEKGPVARPEMVQTGKGS